jgi:hypothetical protein
MAQDPDNVVLVHLREMRVELQDVRLQLQGIMTKLEEHDRRFEDFHFLVNHVLALGRVNQRRSRELEASHDLTGAWQQRTEHRIDQIEHRLGKIEEKRPV